jgi:hypothetical protein
MQFRNSFKNSYIVLSVVLLTVALASAQVEAPATPELPIPNIDAITRADRNTQPTQEELQSSTFILKTQPHPALGDGYVIVTDHRDAGYLEPLRRLAKHRKGTVIQVDDLAALVRRADAREKLITRLQKAAPRFVAIAPRAESYRENTLLAIWQVLSSLDADPQLDVYPGLLVAPSLAAFEALVERSIRYEPQRPSAVRPFVVGQVVNFTVSGQRSLQKVGIMKVLFGQYGCSTPSLVARTFQARKPDAGNPTEDHQWEISADAPRRLISVLPPQVKRAMDEASLLVMYGHGAPGMVCGMDIRALGDVKMTNKVVLCGSCFSAAPRESDFPAMPRGPDGSEIQRDKKSIAMGAVENGATVVYGHMRLNGGFPQLFPVLEAWMDGLTVGEAYQRQINAIIALGRLRPAEFVLADIEDRPAAARRNTLLYVVIGDPALQPLMKMQKKRG